MVSTNTIKLSATTPKTVATPASRPPAPPPALDRSDESRCSIWNFAFILPTKEFLSLISCSSFGGVVRQRLGLFHERGDGGREEPGDRGDDHDQHRDHRQHPAGTGAAPARRPPVPCRSPGTARPRSG